MVDPVWVDGTTPLNSANLTKLQTRDEKGAASGYAPLDSGGKVPLGQLPIGSNGQWLKTSGGAAVWSAITAADVVYEIGYTETAASVAVTATSAPAAGSILSLGPFTYLAQPVLLAFQMPAANLANGEAVLFNLWDGSTDLGRLALIQAPAGLNMQFGGVFGSRRLTPSAGSHTYSVRVWGTVGSGASTVGSAAPTLPFYLRISYV